MNTLTNFTIALSAVILASCAILFIFLEYEPIKKESPVRGKYSPIRAYPDCWDHKLTEKGNLTFNNCKR